jgi:hypothetical protein
LVLHVLIFHPDLPWEEGFLWFVLKVSHLWVGEFLLIDSRFRVKRCCEVIFPRL